MNVRIVIKGKEIVYNLEYKPVKNINIRIKPDCSVSVSANKKVPIDVIEAFIHSKADFIYNSLNKFENMQKRMPVYYYNDDEIIDVINSIVNEVYPYFKDRTKNFPIIKFKKMTSRWGSCNIAKNQLTFNLNLQLTPYECIRYVVIHEFTHFIHFNHSAEFYKELEKLCPDWKSSKNKLKEINLLDLER